MNTKIFGKQLECKLQHWNALADLVLIKQKIETLKFKYIVNSSIGCIHREEVWVYDVYYVVYDVAT